MLDRAETVERVPEFGSSLDAGRVTGDHIDVLTPTLRQLAPGVRDGLVDDAGRLVLIAENSTVDEFARAVRAQARRLECDGDGLERQRRAVRLNTWVDRETGMGRWSAIWDPETMVRLENRLDAQVQALFHDTAPDGCPVDLLERQSFLGAHALTALLEGTGRRLGRPEIVVVVDHTTGSADPVIDWGLPVELPRRVLDELFQTASVHTVVVRNAVVIEAPGTLVWVVRRGSPTGPKAAHCGRCTRRVRSPGVACGTAAPNCTTSSGGATTAAPISTTCCQFVSNIIKTSTTTAGY